MPDASHPDPATKGTETHTSVAPPANSGVLKYLPGLIAAGLVLGAWSYYFHTTTYSSARLMQTLPPDRSMHVFIDVKMLRDGGILEQIAGPASQEDAEYQEFVAASGFNYRTDLDALAIAFRDGDTYFAVQGRFDPARIDAYARTQGAVCEGIICKLPSSQPGHVTSFYMMRDDVLALASADTQTAGDMIAPGTWETAPAIPETALWVSAPPFVFTDLSSVPAGARSFLAPLAQAESAIFTLGPTPDLKALELRMEVTAPTPETAAKIASNFSEVTKLVSDVMRAESIQPNPNELGGVIVGGQFELRENHLTGTWPIATGFLDSLLSDLGGTAP